MAAVHGHLPAGYLEHRYPLFDDPETGERWVGLPDGRMLLVNYEAMQEKLDSGAATGAEMLMMRYLCGYAADD